MLNGPKNGLTYTQNDREKWRNTFTMIVSASLHVLVTEKVQQASTITLAPRCSTHRTLPDQLWWNFSPIPLFLATCAPNISKLVAFTPFLRRAQCDRRGAPLGKRRSPVPRGAAPLPLPRGQATLQFWAVGGAILSLTPKNHI